MVEMKLIWWRQRDAADLEPDGLHDRGELDMSPHQPLRELDRMSNINECLKQAMEIEGAVGVALVDYSSGMCLGQSGGGDLDLEVAAAGNTEVIRAKIRTMEKLGLKEVIEDVLITLGTQYHLIRLLQGANNEGLFLYIALSKSRANLAMARRELAAVETKIVL